MSKRTKDAGVGTMAELEADVAALRRFKAYVHWRLDEAGIPTNPDGPHSKEGCRVGDRLDIALAALDDNKRLRDMIDEVLAQTSMGVDGKEHDRSANISGDLFRRLKRLSAGGAGAKGR